MTPEEKVSKIDTIVSLTENTLQGNLISDGRLLRTALTEIRNVINEK